MPIRPLDLQVNINSVIETSKTEGMKQSLAAQEQRAIDKQSTEEARNLEKMVNKTPKDQNSDEVRDREKHFGSKTEPEMEQEYAKDSNKKRNAEKSKDEESEKSEKSDTDHHIDFLA